MPHNFPVEKHNLHIPYQENSHKTTNENKEKNKKSSDVNNRVKFKFKIVEVINGILD